MARILLVAGAFGGAWCWEYVVPLLEAKGHRVETVELPGMGGDRTPFAETSFDGWARAVADAVEADDEKPILVGHSRGGVVISQAAELVPDRLRMTVYLAALLVGDGKSSLDVQQREDVDIGEMVKPDTADGLGVHPTPELVDFAYANSSEAHKALAASLNTPEPLFGLVTKLALTPERYGMVPRAYVECIDDMVVPLDLQRAMQAAESCAIVRSIATDHCPNFSAPQLLADTLDEVARAY